MAPSGQARNVRNLTQPIAPDVPEHRPADFQADQTSSAMASLCCPSCKKHGRFMELAGRRHCGPGGGGGGGGRHAASRAGGPMHAAAMHPPAGPRTSAAAASPAGCPARRVPACHLCINCKTAIEGFNSLPECWQRNNSFRSVFKRPPPSSAHNAVFFSRPLRKLPTSADRRACRREKGSKITSTCVPCTALHHR